MNWDPRYWAHEHAAESPDAPDDYRRVEGQPKRLCMTVMDRGKPQPDDDPRAAHVGTVIWSGSPYNDDDWDERNLRMQEAREWLGREYPLHKDPFAYWATAEGGEAP